jgi:hypothetical protein
MIKIRSFFIDSIKLNLQHLTKRLEKASPDLDTSKPAHLDHLKQVKVYSKGENAQESTKVVDKKPKKENEMIGSTAEYDVDYEKYGYRKPEKVNIYFTVEIGLIKRFLYNQKKND